MQTVAWCQRGNKAPDSSLPLTENLTGMAFDVGRLSIPLFLLGRGWGGGQLHVFLLLPPSVFPFTVVRQISGGGSSVTLSVSEGRSKPFERRTSPCRNPILPLGEEHQDVFASHPASVGGIKNSGGEGCGR